VAIGDLYQATMNLEGEQGGWSFSWGYEMTLGTIDEFSLDHMCDRFIFGIASELEAVLSNTQIQTTVEFRQVSVGNDLPGDQSALNLAGSVVSPELSANTPILLLWVTDAPNAKFNGKTYLSGIPESSVTNGLVAAGAGNDLDILIAALMQDLTSIGVDGVVMSPRIISRIENGVKRPAPVGYALETGTYSVAIKNQKRRKTERRVTTT
jgi:hypothetical protein